MNIRTSIIINTITKPDNSSEYLHNQEVLGNIDAIVDNFGEFNSTVFGDKDMPLVTKQFIIQRYNLGLSNVEKVDLKAGKSIYLRKPMTQSDNMTIKSLLMMPEPVIRFSTMDLPNTSILQQSAST